MNLKCVCLPILTGAVLAAVGTGCLSLNPKSGRADVERIARDRVPGGQIQSAHLDPTRGQMEPPFDIVKPGAKDIPPVLVATHTGEIMKTDIEAPTGLLAKPRPTAGNSGRRAVLASR